jgi:hypothetical protein
MKQTLYCVLIGGLILAASNALAADYGTAGCGLGAMVFQDQPGKIQIVAATINNIISPQTSAITSGTSNCYESGAREEAAMFITINQYALRNDISRGGGETLTGLSRILKCSDTAQLGTSLQKNYGTIFPAAETNAKDVTNAIDLTIKADTQLMKSCGIYG